MAKYEVVDGVGIIPKGVTEIERWAFSDCTSLTSVVIPESVIAIGGNTFRGCAALKAIYVPVEKKDYYIQSLPGELHSLIVGME